MKNNKQYYFFNTLDIPRKNNKEENKKHIKIITKTGIVLFDSDNYKDECLVVEIS